MRALLYYFAVASSLASVASGLAQGSPQTPVARVAVRDACTMAAQASVVEAAYSEDTFLSKYLERVGAQNVCADPGDLKPTLPILRAVMSAQTRAVPFENIDVALERTISMSPEAVTRKLVDQKRGGYCFEQNTLLKLALEHIGFDVTPLLCRVRWGKKADEETGFTHMCLRVEIAGEGPFLADVGFAGTNSIEPISLSATEPAVLSDGTWSTSERDGYVFLSVQDREQEGVLRDLYCWSTTGCMYPDLLQANHWSCTWGTARFTSQLFVARTNEAQTEKMHILNNKFVRRAIAGDVQETTEITSVEQLEEMLRTHFNLDLGAWDPETLEAVQTGNGVKRYL